MPRRFMDDGRRIYAFGGSFLVRCPRCHRRAAVARPETSDAVSIMFDQLFAPRRCTCLHCGLARDWERGPVRIGGPHDWYFGYPLWLQTACCGHTLWACNAAHLSFLEDYVAADLRERPPHDHTNVSLASRLPSWMTSAKHREEVARCLGRLRELLK